MTYFVYLFGKIPAKRGFSREGMGKNRLARNDKKKKGTLVGSP